MDIGPLYQQHKDTLHRVAASILREVGLQGEKDDVVSEAMLSVASNPPTEEIRNWEAFLVRVVKNKAYDRIRAAEVRHFGRTLDMDHDDHAELGDDAITDTDEKLDGARAGAHVWDSMAVLDERERQVIREVIQNQRPQGEVGDELGVSRPRVNQILKAALQKLREELERKGVAR
ncbi:sigma-70 family RNA polymerase sigma factor [Agromyces sp. LHK192]|uniref:sigma-70 family RNA polymerase sigma factor n=1 Tax=Agromyces sp. LHK192 TaxID=2498704 RepID=UPI000FD83FC3|nr:sigma-70 family RNA polymerase sigma factor [Agromyces sp. LHK192]